MAVPILSFGYEGHFDPVGMFVLLKFVTIAAGWVFGSALLAAVAGLFRPND